MHLILPTLYKKQNTLTKTSFLLQIKSQQYSIGKDPQNKAQLSLFPKQNKKSKDQKINK
jgi:hypothetical protein